MKHSIDELMLQKCVDGELSDHERSELLKQLQEQECVENWKTLALSFIENQVFTSVFAEDFPSTSANPNAPSQEQTPTPELTTVPPRVSSSRQPWLQRQVRPWASVAASLCVGLLVGIGGHFMMNSEDGSHESLVQHTPVQPKRESGFAPNMPASIASNRGSGPSLQNSRTASTPVMGVNRSGVGKSGATPVSIPVYSPEQWQAMPHMMHHASVPDEVRRVLEAQGLTVDHQRQWYRAPLNDGREILVPTETMHVRHAIQ